MNKTFLIYITWALIAIFAASTNGVCVKAFGDTSVLLIILLRTQISCMAQIPLFIKEFATNPKMSSSYLVDNLWIIFISGVLYSLQCILGALSFAETSIAHSICFSNSTPILVVIIQFFTSSKPSILQSIGVFMGFGGLTFMALTASNTDGSTVYGDFLALLSGICLLGYLIIGKKINKQGIVWLFFCPVNFFTSLVSLIMIIGSETENISKVFDWTSPQIVFFVLYIALVPGTFSHGSYNCIIKVLSPILLTSLLSLSPLFGTLIGMCLGLQALPTLYTFVGGTFSIIGNIITILAEKKTKDEKILLESENKPTDDLNNNGSPEIKQIAISTEINQEDIPGSVHVVLSEVPDSERQQNSPDDNNV